MDVRRAIATHTQWRFRVRGAIAGVLDERLDPSAVASDSQCELGRWLHGAGLAYQDHPVVVELRKTHLEFHQKAASLVSDVNAGAKVDAASVGPGSDFMKLSTRITTLLTDLGAVLRGP
jgi:hypothetical protein